MDAYTWLRIELALWLLAPTLVFFVLHIIFMLVSKWLFKWEIYTFAAYAASIIYGAWVNSELILNSWR